MKPRAVVFDLGKVLVDFDYSVAARKLAEQARASAAEIQALIDQSPLLFRYECAGMTTQEFFAEVRDRVGFQGDFEEFAAAFADIFTEIPEMTRLQAELRNDGRPTFVLSNTNEIAIAHVRRNFPFFSRFTDYVFSFAHGVLKPDPRIYEVVEKLSGCRGSELVFIDDRPENVDAAARRGWRTICHSSAEESIRTVREWIS